MLERCQVTGYGAYKKAKDSDFVSLKGLRVLNDDSCIWADIQSSKSCDLNSVVIQSSVSVSVDVEYLSFRNVLFAEYVYIDCSKVKLIEFEACICLGSVRLFGVGLGGKPNVRIMRSNFNELDVSQCMIGSFEMYYCKINGMGVERSSFDDYRVNNSSIMRLVSYGNVFNFCYFDHEQVSLSGVGITKGGRGGEEDFDRLFKYDPLSVHKPSLPRDKIVFLETCDFLVRDSTLSFDKKALSDVKELMALKSQSNIVMRCILWALGGFVKPWRVVLMGLFFVVSFACVYLLPCFSARIDGQLVNGLGLIDSLSFSFLTIVTLGYGDIVPQGLSRIVCAVEGFFGILTTSSFIVSMIRKYTDSKSD